MITSVRLLPYEIRLDPQIRIKFDCLYTTREDLSIIIDAEVLDISDYASSVVVETTHGDFEFFMYDKNFKMEIIDARLPSQDTDPLG